MRLRGFLAVLVVMLFLAGPVISQAAAQPRGGDRPTEMADDVEHFARTWSSNPNQHKFFSILIFVVLGGACTYAGMRGIKKIVSKD